MSLTTATHFRVDIQALRGLAVLWVVFYHAKLLPIASGYLGVDIFFVISGFLITSQIAQQVKAGTFSFNAFYYRRARRLLPAAYCVFAVCLILSPWLLSSLERIDFSKQLFGAMTFTGNVVLWLQTGYFEQAAELKPLLHTWSLAIEEQYYLLLPLALVFINRRYWLLGMAIVMLMSLVLYSHYAPTKPDMAFYLFPTRAWELCLGSLLALAPLPRPQNRLFSRCLAGLGWLLIVVVPILALPSHIPSVLTMFIVCLATAIVIYAQTASWNNNPVIKILAQFGTLSYSLYLVHWPIFSFLNNANVSGGGLWWPIRLGAVLASFLLAYCLYRFIEQRFRLHQPETNMKQGVMVMLVVSVLLAIAAIGLSGLGDQKRNGSHRLNKNVGLSFDCRQLNFASLPQCRTTDEPTVLIWGDSYAMHWVPGMATTDNVAIMQAARPSCAPVMDLALFAPPTYGQQWAENCINFNQTVLAGIAKIPSIQTVVLAAQWPYLFNAIVVKKDGDVSQPLINTNSALAENLIKTIEAVRQLDKKVVLMAQPPAIGFDIGRCIERKNTGKILFGAPEQCRIPVALLQTRNADLNDFLQQVSEQGSVNVLSLQDQLCNQEHCLTEIGDVALYRDVGHLSHEGSIFIAKEYQLMQKLQQLAR